MMQRRVLLMGLPGCVPCRNRKKQLEQLQEELGYEVEYIEDVTRREDLVRMYDIQSVPVIVAGNAQPLVGGGQIDKLRQYLTTALSSTN